VALRAKLPRPLDKALSATQAKPPGQSREPAAEKHQGARLRHRLDPDDHVVEVLVSLTNDKIFDTNDVRAGRELLEESELVVRGRPSAAVVRVPGACDHLDAEEHAHVPGRHRDLLAGTP
jgi:hypothetical protein